MWDVRRKQISGEYWINNGSVDYADGDVGEYNHEYIASSHVFHQFSDKIVALAEELNISTEDLNDYDIDLEALGEILNQIHDNLEDTDVDPYSYIGRYIGADQEAVGILFGKKDSRLYVMKKEGWIAVRGMNIELHGYDEQKRKNLINGLGDIFEQEGIQEDIPPEEIDFLLYDHKTNRSNDLTLADIENPQPVVRPHQMPTNKGDRRFQVITPDKTENIPYQNKSIPNKTNVAAQKAGIVAPGQELWRGTSESTNFKNWLLFQEGIN